MTTGHPADNDVEPIDREDKREDGIDERRPPTVSPSHLIEAVARREIRTVVRTPTFALLAVVLVAVLVGITRLGGGARAGYVPATADLLTPLELLVPTVAVAFGYRAVLDDARRGELDVLRTYPLTPRQFVLGVYLGRAIGLLAAIILPLLAAMATVALTETPSIRFYATHAGSDSPVLFLRVIVLTAVFGLVVLAVAVAISAIASTIKNGLALALVALVLLLFGADLALVSGLNTDLIGDSWFVYVLAASPNSAYRGLILESTISVVSGTGPRAASPLVSVFSLILWTVVSLIGATVAVSRQS
ncbi:ABC transporter permease subunit [Halobacteria archaeon AArc-m2/3/4]|uniref:ABC transporter permease subunit n=1 Tax=Natronoglomus mannanivorans TaxID=2979990 RepID=A0AAP3E445_9EURY|nr:ABC transporter permease subunit [Halobacteria archaeon AArc-xg1-1]MCU4975816.1 ABC transporter permease subunit [Halobacteria archaeon AArc-m2/3/4]